MPFLGKLFFSAQKQPQNVFICLSSLLPLTKTTPPANYYQKDLLFFPPLSFHSNLTTVVFRTTGMVSEIKYSQGARTDSKWLLDPFLHLYTEPVSICWLLTMCRPLYLPWMKHKPHWNGFVISHKDVEIVWQKTGPFSIL